MLLGQAQCFFSRMKAIAAPHRGISNWQRYAWLSCWLYRQDRARAALLLRQDEEQRGEGYDGGGNRAGGSRQTFPIWQKEFDISQVEIPWRDV
jgi:hypothetical protein